MGWALAVPFFAMHTATKVPIAAAGMQNGMHARRARNCDGIAEQEPTAGEYRGGRMANARGWSRKGCRCPISAAARPARRPAALDRTNNAKTARARNPDPPPPLPPPSPSSGALLYRRAEEAAAGGVYFFRGHVCGELTVRVYDRTRKTLRAQHISEELPTSHTCSAWLNYTIYTRSGGRTRYCENRTAPAPPA